MHIRCVADVLSVDGNIIVLAENDDLCSTQSAYKQNYTVSIYEDS